MAGDERYCFLVEWYDQHAALNKQYQFVFYPKDNTIEMFDCKNHRVFLRRTKSEITLANLYIGSSVNIMSRQLTFVDYGDSYTKKILCSKTQRTLGMIKPDAISNMGAVLEAISRGGFLLTQLRMCRLSRNDAFRFYEEHQSKDFFGNLVSLITSGPVIAFELMGEGAIMKWRDLIGPTDSAQARSQAPMSLRARFGTDNTQNACHGSDSPESAQREINFFFGSSIPNTATFEGSTCAVIKPHAVLDGSAGKIIQKIQESFSITALRLYHMEKANAEEFYEVYKGVVQEYPEMVKELISGPSIAMEICPKSGMMAGPDASCPKAFRDFCGPADPEIARHLRSHTLRAQFGRNKIQNAIHCTDLPEDGLLEAEYFFKILDR